MLVNKAFSFLEDCLPHAMSVTGEAKEYTTSRCEAGQAEGDARVCGVEYLK